jgi:hypothetical protein
MAEAPATPNGAIAASLRGAARTLALVPPPPEPTPAWTTPPGDDGRLARAERAWRVRREALERELSGAAGALTVARDAARALRTAIAAAHADLRAARAARAADSSTLAILSAELDAERIAHAVARATAARLATDLAAARAELSRRPPVAAAAAISGDAAAVTGRAASAVADGGGAAPVAGEADFAAPPAGGLGAAEALRRRALEQAAAAAVARPAARDGGRLVADLDAAAAALRRTAPDDEVGERWLRRALVAFARVEPLAAGRLLIGLLPAQGAVVDGPLSYDLTLRGLGTFSVTVKDGSADVRRVAQARRRGEAVFHLRAEPLALAQLLAGEPCRIGRFRGRARATGQRRRTAELAPLAGAPLSLAGALDAGARLAPELVYGLLPFAIAPEWTRGHTFTVAQEIAGLRTWFVSARDGAPLAVSTRAAHVDATVTMTRAGFDALLRGAAPEPQDRPSIRGDRVAVAALKRWTDRARGAG